MFSLVSGLCIIEIPFASGQIGKLTAAVCIYFGELDHFNLRFVIAACDDIVVRRSAVIIVGGPAVSRLTYLRR